MNLAYGQGGLKLEINIPPRHIPAKSKGGLIIEGGLSSSEYGTSVVPINRIGYWILPDNQQFIGVSMTDKQILVVRMRITHLVQTVHCWLYCLASWLMQSLGRSCLSGSTLWWEKTPISHYVGSVSNPFRAVGVTQRCTSLQT